jgi:hypothetical protein
VRSSAVFGLRICSNLAIVMLHFVAGAVENLAFGSWNLANAEA